jgi:hypothetical protein
MAGDDGQTAVYLFQQQNPDDLVRDGEGAEGKNECRLAAHGGIEAVRAADCEDGRARSLVAPASKALGQSFARDALAALVERHQEVGAGALDEHAAFLRAPVVLSPCAAFRDFDHLKRRKAGCSAKRLGTPAIALSEVALRPALQLSDSEDGELHAAIKAASPSNGKRRPQLSPAQR